MKPARSKTYTTTVQYCEFENEYFINFPEEMMKELDWVEGDTLQWEVLDDCTVVISKVED